MTNINNHRVGMNKINMAADFHDLDNKAATAIRGGDLIQLYTGKNFTGRMFFFADRRREFRFYLLRLGGNAINNNISSAKVISGKWVLRTGPFGGPGVFLRKGWYPRFAKRFNNTFSSLIHPDR